MIDLLGLPARALIHDAANKLAHALSIVGSARGDLLAVVRVNKNVMSALSAESKQALTSVTIHTIAGGIRFECGE